MALGGGAGPVTFVTRQDDGGGGLLADTDPSTQASVTAESTGAELS